MEIISICRRNKEPLEKLINMFFIAIMIIIAGFVSLAIESFLYKTNIDVVLIKNSNSSMNLRLNNILYSVVFLGITIFFLGMSIYEHRERAKNGRIGGVFILCTTLSVIFFAVSILTLIMGLFIN